MRLILKKSSIFQTVLIFSLLILVFFYDAFADKIGFFDEFLGLIAVFVILYRFAIKQKLRLIRNEYYIILLLMTILILGLTSNIYTCIIGYCTKPTAIFSDLITFSKAFIVYFAVRLLNKSINSSLILQRTSKYLEVIFYFLVFLVVLDIILKLYPRENRFGIQSIELFFKHTSRYAFAFAFIFLILLPKYFKYKIGFLLFILFIGALSLRFKYFAFLFLALTVLFFGKKLIKKTSKSFFLWIVSLLIIVLAFIFREKIQMFFTFENIDDAWSRAVVLYYSFIVGIDFFPLGTGFGTYSSYYSGVYYSWVYDLYGISNVYGISRVYWNFIADQYWPMVLGQFGYFGLFSMFGVAYNYITIFLNNIKANIDNSNYYLYLSPLLGFFMLLIDSTSDAIFSQQRAVAMFIFFALVVNISQKNNESPSSQ